MANLEEMDEELYAFNSQPNVYRMVKAFINEFEEQKIDFLTHPPPFKKLSS
jgi:hypothetical protein